MRYYVLFTHFIEEECFCFKQKTAYEMRISDWSSDVCSSDLGAVDENLPELRRLRRLDIEVQRLWIVRHSGEQQIVGFGHRAPDVVGDAVADLPFVEKFACHGQSLRCSFMPTWLWTKPSRA